MSYRAVQHHREFRAGEAYAQPHHDQHDWVAEHAAQHLPDDAYYERDHASDCTPAAQLVRPRRAAPNARRSTTRKDYTLGHGAWQVRIGPVAFWICVGTLVIMAAWAGITATYFAFHDDVLSRLIARQAQMQFAYEDRIAEMRAQVDRVTSRQLLDQEQFERRLDQIAKRQSALEARSSSLGTLTDPNTTGSIKPPTRGLTRDSATPPKPSPINGWPIITAPSTRDAAIEPSVESRRATLALNGGVEGAITRLQSSLDRVEARQTASLNSLEESYDSKVKRLR